MVGTPNAIVTSDVLLEHRDILLKAIEAGVQEKNRVYTKGAMEISKFYLGQHKYIFDPKFNPNQLSLTIRTDATNTKQVRQPVFQMSDNVAANYLMTFAPWLLQGTLKRLVTATKPFQPPPVCYGIEPQQMQMMKLQQMQQMPNGQQMAMMYWQQQQQAQMQAFMDQVSNSADYELRQARAGMMEMLSNYSAMELGYAAERRRAVEESLILGGGLWLTQITQFPQSGQKLIGSQNVMMNDIVWDPDAVRTKDCKWMAIQCRAPAWVVSRLFGIPEDEIKPNSVSNVANTYHESLIITAGPENVNNRIRPEDEVVYWKFWSRMGAGARLRPVGQRHPEVDALDKMLGDNCFFIVSNCCDYCLNLSPAVFNAVEQMSKAKQIIDLLPMPPEQKQQVDVMAPLKKAVAWQIPFHLDEDDPWPVTQVSYYERNGSPYPIPPLEFALAYMKFMVWVISFIADKCYRSNRQFWAIDDSNNEQLKKAIEDGEDECIIPLKNLDQKSIDSFIKMIEAPDMKASLLDVYEFFNKKFETVTRMNELNQATMSRAMRSATEASILEDASKLVPQAMMRSLLDAETRVARKEAIASILLLSDKDVTPCLGGPGGRAWNTVMKIDPLQLMRETTYDVVASQGRVIDISTRMDQTNKMAQLVLPLLVQIGQVTGVFGPANAILQEWAKANQIDPDLVRLPDMPPPMMNPNAKGNASQPAERQPSQGQQ